MISCLFCNKHGPYTRPEHIIPEALGNNDLILVNQVCDSCNQYFGKEVEEFVLAKSPLAFWRTFLGIKKKRGELPHIDLSQPKRQKGRLPALHPAHDNLVGFTCHGDYSMSVDIDNDEIIKEILIGKREQFVFVFTPLVLSLMGRFFCKVGIELLCHSDAKLARSKEFMRARRFARFGEFEGLWPIFHVELGDIKDLKERAMDADAILEEVFVYQYQLFNVVNMYTILGLTVGTDAWIVSLNDPYPLTIIRPAFPTHKLDLIWYGQGEWQKTNKCSTASSLFRMDWGLS